MQLTPRQKSILAYIGQKESVSTREVLGHLGTLGLEAPSRATVIRDLDALVRSGEIRKTGAGRGVRYRLAVAHPLLLPVDIEQYFALPADERCPVAPRFRPAVIGQFHSLLAADEERKYARWNDEYRSRREGVTPTLRRKEFERITIELSWKSSRIEGNTYSLIDTEVLLKDRREAPGHRREEAVMILNHKSAFDWILEHPEIFRRMTLGQVENLHRLLVADLGIPSGLRKRPVFITGTNYRPLDNEHQIREVLERLLQAINEEPFPLGKALMAALLVAAIQPFEDGNKRVSRLLANAALLAHDFCPLSLRSIDEAAYKKAVIVFYETESARPFKELFLEQFRFAVAHTFVDPAI